MILTEGNTLSTINNTKSVVRPITAPPAPKTKNVHCHSNKGNEILMENLRKDFMCIIEKGQEDYLSLQQAFASSTKGFTEAIKAELDKLSRIKEIVDTLS